MSGRNAAMPSLTDLRAEVRALLDGGAPIADYTPDLPAPGEIGTYEVLFWESTCLRNPRLVEAFHQAGWRDRPEKRANGTTYRYFIHDYLA